MISKIYKKTDKTKYVSSASDYDNNYQVSFYSNLIYPNQNVIIQDLENGSNLLMTGSLQYPNPLKVTLHRIILTGYPLKIKKKNAIVRYMFFNELDIRYFKDNEVYTKKGLKGKIKESLGTHGLMKVNFNGKPSHGDTVCMNLYKRVFPKYIY